MTTAAVATMALVLIASRRDGPDGRAEAAPTGAPPSNLAGPFPFGVWLQDPMQTVGGESVAVLYRKLGINHWMGLYDWPSEVNRYPGYNLHAAQALSSNGFRVYAGEDQAAITWNLNHPQYANTFVGYVMGDEPDMTKQWVPANHPVAFRAACQLMRQNDPSRLLWANFGKGFAKIPWPGYQAFPGPTIQDDHNKYTDFLDIASVSFYGLTDPYEMPVYVGIWTYGRAIDNTRHYVDANPSNPGLPVWGFIETGSTFVSHTGRFEKMPADLIAPTVWNMIVHGATGITYFAHDINAKSIDPVFPLDHPHIGQAVQETNASVTAFGAVLVTPTVPGTTVTTNGNVTVTALTKQFEGDTYVFAMGDGNQAYQEGQSVDATISFVAAGTTVTELGESRNVPMVDSSFTDHFNPYQLRIYRISK
ncbi:MAG TPA: hypothetical protein VFZ65_23585 [Planctomycetota bacterium]|nr:hypothetical protein [Planctomycetota bacterium]